MKKVNQFTARATIIVLSTKAIRSHNCILITMYTVAWSLCIKLSSAAISGHCFNLEFYIYPFGKNQINPVCKPNLLPALHDSQPCNLTNKDDSNSVRGVN